MRSIRVMFRSCTTLASGSVGQSRCVILQPLHRHKSTQSQQEKIKIKAEPPKVLKRDWVGPPDPSSNIRTVRLFVPPNESPLEKRYREKREEVWQWNHEFWEKHNIAFFKQKEEFIAEGLAKKKSEHPGDDSSSQSLSSEELSVFYRRFLNDNFKSHLWYNKEWYKRNISLLWPAFQVTVSRFLTRQKKNKQK